MNATRLLPAVALILLFPARCDESASAKAPVPDGAKKNDASMSCCAGEEARLCPKAKTAKTAAKKPAAAKRTEPGASNLVVSRDPETGQLRPATAVEREQLLGRHPLVAVAPEVVTLPDGTVMLKQRPEDANYAVATRNADGTLSYACVHGVDAAHAAATPAPAPKSADR